MHHSHRSLLQIRRWLEHFLPVPGHAQVLKFLPVALWAVLWAKSCHLNRIAVAMPGEDLTKTGLQRLRRWIARPRFDTDEYLAAAALGHFRSQRQRLVILTVDRTDWKHANLLCAASSYHGRCLPLAHLVLSGPKATHHRELRELFTKVQAALPEDAKVVVIADREFGNVPAMRVIREFGWHFCLRFKTDTWVYRTEGNPAQARDLYPARGGRDHWHNVRLTGHRYGPLNMAIIWAKKRGEPWILVSDLQPNLLYSYYRRRMRIDEMFSDLKKRGFQLEDTRLRDPLRLLHLLGLLSLTYLWLLLCGAIILEFDWRRLVDPAKRRALSYLQIALRLLTCRQDRAPTILAALADSYDEK
jgi:hypothetical protein